MTNWNLHNFMIHLIKEALEIDESVYMNTDEIEVEIDGDTVIYYIPIEYGHEMADIRLTIFPDFTYRIDLY